MKKLIFILLILMAPMVLGYNTGEYHTIYEVDKCDGPFNVKVTSGNIDDIDVDKCKQDGEMWNCTCVGSFNVDVKADNGTNNIYDFKIQYYLNHFEVGNSSQKRVDLESYRRIQVLKDVKFESEDKKFNLNMSIEMQNFILFIILLVIGIIIISIHRLKKTNSVKSEDVMNYSVKEDDELDDKIKRFK